MTFWQGTLPDDIEFHVAPRLFSERKTKCLAKSTKAGLIVNNSITLKILRDYFEILETLHREGGSADAPTSTDTALPPY